MKTADETDEKFHLPIESVEGEIALVIQYHPGKSEALGVLAGAMRLIESLDKLDHCLLSSIDSDLEPVSILNDVQHSSLKILLARALRKTPDELISNMDWKKWVGSILIKGKYKLLERLDADAPQIREVLIELEPDYQDCPVGLIGFTPPSVADIHEALNGVSKARASLPMHSVTIQTELGDIFLSDAPVIDAPDENQPQNTITNTGVEFFKVKSTDMLGQSQWTVVRNNRIVKVDLLHKSWLLAYQRRQHAVFPGDSLECRFEESITYDANHNELERRLSIIEVIRVISPAIQHSLI